MGDYLREWGNGNQKKREKASTFFMHGEHLSQPHGGGLYEKNS